MNLLHIAYDVIIKELSHNQFLSGGAIIGSLGFIIAWARNVPYKMIDLFWKYTTVSMVVNNDDQSFLWLKYWLHEQPYSNSARRQMLSSRCLVLDDDDGPITIAGKNKIYPVFTPAPGFHWWFRGARIIWMTYDRDKAQAGSSDSMVGTIHESYKLSTVGWSPSILRAIVLEAQILANKSLLNGVGIYASPYNSGFSLLNVVPTRPSKTLFLPNGVLEDLQNDIKIFFNSREKYYKLGIPYHRGVLLYGPAGTGKTSTIITLAGMMNLSVYLINVQGIADRNLLHLLTCVPPRNFLVFEDIDTLFFTKNGSKDVRSGRGNTEHFISFSGFVNALDGVMAREGIVIFMTTNYKDRLDSALIRPGRIDRQIYLGLADHDQIRGMLNSFFPSVSCQELDNAVNMIPEFTLPMATIQEMCLRNLDSWPGLLLDIGKHNEKICQ